ncbi:MAG: SAM-dependent methyltransferase, partial [Acidobacteria bacterium]|nr:SAM-dependent methyltransferase [Acidobacteriota bacterium]
MKRHDEQPALAGRLRERIAREGAITFRDWMQAALYDERAGYYRRADLARWGRAGDYRTSPERTPLFAATFARYFAALHGQLGSPSRWTIYEAGAGACDFARVALETLAQDHPEVFRATRYVVDEIGEGARRLAAEKLAPFAERIGVRRFAGLVGDDVRRGDADNGDASDSGDASRVGVVFSNELVDAFAVHRVVMREGGLRELRVGLGASGGFEWVEREPSTPRLAEHFARLGVVLREGQFAEVNLAADEWIARAASLVSRGFVVTVDYGAASEELYDADARPGGTLRAFRAHTFSDDVLASPGEQDITSTVNWTQLVVAGREAGLETVTLERLDKFLLSAGVVGQLESMSARASDEG